MGKVKRTLDKALKCLDRRTIMEEDGVEIVEDGGYYILYVDGKAVADDGNLDKIKRMYREELRHRD